MLEHQHRCGCLEVGVVVDNGELVCGGQGRGQQVRHADGTMLAGSCQHLLCAQCDLPMLVIGRQILVGGTAVSPELLVFAGPETLYAVFAFHGQLGSEGYVTVQSRGVVALPAEVPTTRSYLASVLHG